jgi:release factor glutamine methyltransferase
VSDGLQGAMMAVDASPRALAIAEMNCRRCGLQQRVTAALGDGNDWYSALEPHMGQLAGVVSNPPYIPAATILTLQASTLNPKTLNPKP